MEYNGNWYAVITADLLYDESITARQKLLVAVVSNLSNTKGFCFASNAHLAKLMGVSVSSLQRDLSALEGKYLGRVVNLKPNGQVDYRALTPINNNNPMSSVNPPHPTSDMTPHPTSDTYNNIYSNNKVNTNDIGFDFYSNYCSVSGHNLTQSNRSKTEKALSELTYDDKQEAVSKFKDYIEYQRAKQEENFGKSESKFIPLAYTYIKDRLWKDLPQKTWVYAEACSDGMNYRYRYESDNTPCVGKEIHFDKTAKKHFVL